MKVDDRCVDEAEQNVPHGGDRRRDFPRRSVFEERPHHESEVERGRVGDESLPGVVATTQSDPAMRAGLARQSERALDKLAPQFQQCLSLLPPDALTVVMKRFAREHSALVDEGPVPLRSGTGMYVRYSARRSSSSNSTLW